MKVKACIDVNSDNIPAVSGCSHDENVPMMKVFDGSCMQPRLADERTLKKEGNSLSFV
jgi:hypothetical protein